MIRVIILFSQFENQSSIPKRLKEEISFLEKNKYNVFYINSVEGCSEYLSENSLSESTILFIASGGTEELAKMLIDVCEHPILLVANSKQNSLAASLEIFSIYRENKIIKHFYYDIIADLFEEINNYQHVINAIENVNNSIIGLIGEPSNWLLTSKNINSFGAFNTKLINIDIDEISDEVNTNSSQNVASKIETEYQHKLVCSNDINNSSKVYNALSKIAEKYNLNALTVRCFDLLKYNYTSCMALSMLNDENTVSGCEGDIFALFTMLVANKLVDEPVWMANPASIIKKENSLILAHCTIPSKMLSSLENSQLTTHMESGLSVAIQGPLKIKEVTILRIGGNFDKILFSTGQIVETDMRDPHLCRTQVKVKFDSDIQSWMNNALGNHQILVYGNISKLLIDFCNFTGIHVIEC